MIIRFLRPKASNGLNSLVSALKDSGHDVKKLKINGSSYRGVGSHFIINWGSASRRTISESMRIFNDPSAVAIAFDKTRTFQKLQDEGLGQYLPIWTTSKEEALRLISEDCHTIYCRTLTRSSQGSGIVIASLRDEVVDAPLYTTKINVRRELRVHVFGEDVIDFAQKKKMSSERQAEEGIEQVNEDIRSHHNGWVFARSGVEIPDEVKEIAVRAIKALGLDFGAVDIALTPNGNVKIYEINTAPGLEGTTLESYRNAIDRAVNS